VTTEFLNPDGSVARTVEGEYEFDWVVPDRVLLGRSRPPEPDQAAGLLFYYQESQNMVGMASVGADGHLWVMTGAADKEVRHTPPTPMPDGSIVELRFTRYNVEPEQFESKMEFSTDAGSTWTQRNHQIFRRASVPAPVGDPESNRLTWENLAASLDAEAAAGFTAAVLIVRDGEIVLDEGYGLANRDLGIPITPDSIFATGSLPIDYTHASIFWLAQEGKLGLPDPITRYFSNVPEDKRAITIEHLMTGASGLPDFHDLPSDLDPDHSWIDRDEAMRRIFAQKLLFPPGQGDEHSHSAWGVLAAIVEIVSGQSYQDFTRQHLFAPAGMIDTGFNGDPVPAERLAIGYGTISDGEINAPPYWGKTSWLVLGSGGQTGTTRDTARWLDAMREGRILEPEWSERYFGPGVGASRNGDNYGFEMFVYNGPGAESYAITVTNANKPESEFDDETQFVRLSREIGNLLLSSYLPKFRLGIAMDPRPDGTIEITQVGPGSAAERDGLRQGDLLVSAGGVAFGEDPMTVLDPYLASGEPVVFVVRRDGRELEVTVRPNPR
jgi:CubicO group peptidase (beta-lactamase class C family)